MRAYTHTNQLIMEVKKCLETDADGVERWEKQTIAPTNTCVAQRVTISKHRTQIQSNSLLLEHTLLKVNLGAGKPQEWTTLCAEGARSSVSSEKARLLASSPPSVLQSDLLIGGYPAFVKFLLSRQNSPATPTIQYIFFDFDGTLTVAPFLARLQRHVISDDSALVASLTKLEVDECFGGLERLSHLMTWLQELRSRSVTIFILSHGRLAAIESLLKRAGLGDLVQKVFASDMAQMQALGNVKASLIREFVRSERGLNVGDGAAEATARSAAAASILFVDDREDHIHIADGKGICRTMLVAAQGLNEGEMHQIMLMCVGGGAEKGVRFASGGAHACLIPQVGKGKKAGVGGAHFTVDAVQAGGRTVFLPAAGGAAFAVGHAPSSAPSSAEATPPPPPPGALPPVENREQALQLLASAEIERQGEHVQIVPYPVADAAMLARLAPGTRVTRSPVYDNGFAGLEWSGLVVGVDAAASVALLAFLPGVEPCGRDAPELGRETATATTIETTTVRLRRGHVSIYPNEGRAEADRLFAHRTSDAAAYRCGQITSTAAGIAVRCHHIDAKNGFVFVSRA